MDVLGLLLPQRCAVCSSHGSPLCPHCRDGLSRLRSPLCTRCGAPTAWPVERCRECSGRRLGFATARAAVLYDRGAQSLVAAWKEHGIRVLARPRPNWSARRFQAAGGGARLRAAGRRTAPPSRSQPVARARARARRSVGAPSVHCDVLTRGRTAGRAVSRALARRAAHRDVAGAPSAARPGPDAAVQLCVARRRLH